MKHDDGLACYALETLAEKFKAANQLPSAITFWSDGAYFMSHIMSLTYSQLCCRCAESIQIYAADLVPMEVSESIRI